jgi:Uma2 family endonuclease
MTTPTAAPRLMTTDELYALPEDDGVDRELIRGELREDRGEMLEEPVTRRNPWHSRVEANLTGLLFAWLRQQPPPRGWVVTGEAAFRIRRNPDTTVGIDVAYADAALAAATPRNARIVDGPPILAIEILSPTDQHERIVEKVRDYLDAGVPLVWVVDPDFETVRVHQPGQPVRLFSGPDELTGDPHLPGLRIPVAEIFAG